MAKKTQQKRRGSVTKRQSAAKPLPQSAIDIQKPPPPSPSPETLAMIAATLARGGVDNPATSIANAAALYDEARAHLELRDRNLAARQAKAEERAALPHPKQLPPTFDDILKLIVCAKTPADGTKRFRDYLRAELEGYLSSNRTKPYPTWAQPAAKARLERMILSKDDGEQLRLAIDEQVAHGIETHKYGITEDAWYQLVKNYGNWWHSHKSGSARAAARSKKPA
jgi:hypothetical protein